MYFNNILRLATKYLKNIIPTDKNSMNLVIEFIESKDNPQIFKETNISLANIDKSFLTVKKFMHGINCILQLSLILDEWLAGIDLKAIITPKLELLLKHYEISDNILNQEQYEALQNALIDLTKDYIKMFSGKPLIKFNEYYINQIIV